MQTPPRAGRYESLFTLPEAAQRRLFADMGSLYPTRPVRRGTSVAALPAGVPLEAGYRFDGGEHDIAGFMARYRATGLIVVHRGRVVCERYADGQSSDTRWISFSMAKSITAALIGAALHDGSIGSLDEPVVRSVPQLAGSAYDEVSIRNVLQMSSGVRWIETYLDPESDRRKLLALQAREEPGVVLEYLRRLPRAAPPGSTFNYSTAETFLLGAIVAGAVRRPLADYLSEKIWQPCGMQADAYWQLESPGGQEFAGSGLSATLRDFARFGLFMLADGVAGGRRILPEGYVAEATHARSDPNLAPGRLPGYEPLGYGYQWWTFEPEPVGNRIFGALGIFGQQIYVDVQAALVIAVNAAWPQPVHDPSRLESYAFFQAVTRALR